MAVQDDARESELITLFGLERPQDAGRSGTDAVLRLDEVVIPFELKSTTKDSVTTVRDFGPDHIRKWQEKHWLIGFYNPDGTRLKHTLYGTPEMMKPWVQEKHNYILPDLVLAQAVPEKVERDLLEKVLGKKEVYTVEDAKRIQKKQYSQKQYLEFRDREGGYSPERMLEILQDRCRYLLSRGATLNNPHIPGSYFKGWAPIKTRHATSLRERVRDYLDKKRRSEQAT